MSRKAIRNGRARHRIPDQVPRRGRIYNIGNHRPEELTRVVAILEQ
jgi:UDP-glucuronate 4-epimerase